MGVFLAAQNAMNQLWGVPFKRRPDPLRARGRALLLLLLLGGATLGTTILAGLSTAGPEFGPLRKIGSLALSTALNIGIFWVGFRVLTAREVSLRQLRGGAIAAAVLYTALQSLGGYYVGHVLHRATNTYGTFALVIGLLSWIYLATPITLLAAEGKRRHGQGTVATQLLRRDRAAAYASGQGSPYPARESGRGRRQDETIAVDFSEAEEHERDVP